MIIASLLPGPLPVVLYAIGVALFAGFVRGFSGFGLSAFIVAGMSLWISPQSIVPAAMMLEIVASISLLRSVWPHVSWRWIWPLVAGYAISVPLGVWCLAILPELPLRLAVSTIILVMALTLLSGFRPSWGDGIGVRLRNRSRGRVHVRPVLARRHDRRHDVVHDVLAGGPAASDADHAFLPELLVRIAVGRTARARPPRHAAVGSLADRSRC